MTHRATFLQNKEHPVVSNIKATADSTNQKKKLVSLFKEKGRDRVIKENWDDVLTFLDFFWYNKVNLIPHGDTSFVMLECNERLSVDRRSYLWCFYSTQDVDEILVLLSGVELHEASCVGCVAYRQGFIYAISRPQESTKWIWFNSATGELKEIGVWEADYLDEQRHSLTSFIVKKPENACCKELVIPSMTFAQKHTPFVFKLHNARTGDIRKLSPEFRAETVLLDPFSYYFAPLSQEIVFMLARIKDRESHEHKRFGMFMLRKSCTSAAWTEIDGDINDLLPSSTCPGMVSIAHHPTLNLLFCSQFNRGLSQLILHVYDWKDTKRWYLVGQYPLGSSGVKRNMMLYIYNTCVVARFEERGMTRASVILTSSLCFRFHSMLRNDRSFLDVTVRTASVHDESLESAFSTGREAHGCHIFSATS
mmetsp:Transcript_5547/g.20865  ORF Transcript_5547/g.20865 Transcript_5547/m.20865 type:complete len:422 (-) Transcript_5547:1788-3053(-)|eukprot:CAMPEP_0117438004 /NCGR_PEP_ID=MMETSP0759-20121206/1824_1 /TAXON_ID=63605 /ORGANISM="Percolomonas cosmopolitus, Strain WS" /LENGTH=421 /DNA_ID=CAMNT_0005229671 /DNA_START=561 /DNA_END=1826 /DNA_ORIENTATION=-